MTNEKLDCIEREIMASGDEHGVLPLIAAIRHGRERVAGLERFGFRLNANSEDSRSQNGLVDAMYSALVEYATALQIIADRREYEEGYEAAQIARNTLAGKGWNGKG